MKFQIVNLLAIPQHRLEEAIPITKAAVKYGSDRSFRANQFTIKIDRDIQ
jgi:hypothetical protein